MPRLIKPEWENMMKIVIYGARGVPVKWSGFDTFITQLALRLVEKGNEVVAFCQPKYTDKKTGGNTGE